MTGPTRGEAELASADAHASLGRIRNRLLRFAGLVVLIFAVPSLLASGPPTP